jgi:mannose-6-phosphate isomerase-like protein (cupin superfamily)
MIKHSVIFIWIFGALVFAAAQASATVSFQYIPEADSKAAVKDTIRGPAVKVYFTHDNFLGEVAARAKTGQVEIHNKWTDYMLVLDGDAKLTVGGTAVNMKKIGPGESRGDSITGGRTVSLQPGDIVTIPAGMPHWMQLTPGARIRYFVAKTKE